MNDEPPAFAGIGPDPAHDPDAWPWGAAVEVPVDLPIEYEAYAMANRPAFLRFAKEMLDDQATAREIVHEVLTYLAIHWTEILREPNVADVTWAVLSGAVAAEVHRSRREEQLATRIANVRDLLARMRDSLTDPDADDTAIGLFPALSILSPRQFDVIILKGPMDRSTFFTAWILHMHPSTVDRNHNRALARLEEVLRPRRVLHPDTPNRPRRRGARR